MTKVIDRLGNGDRNYIEGGKEKWDRKHTMIGKDTEIRDGEQK